MNRNIPHPMEAARSKVTGVGMAEKAQLLAGRVIPHW